MRRPTFARVSEAAAAGIVAASAGFTLGWLGPSALVAFPILLPAMALAAGPGMVLGAFVLVHVVDAEAHAGAGRNAIRGTAVLIALAAGGLNLLAAQLAWSWFLDGFPQFTLREMPMAHLLGGVGGGLGMAWGIAHDVEPEAGP